MNTYYPTIRSSQIDDTPPLLGKPLGEFFGPDFLLTNARCMFGKGV